MAETKQIGVFWGNDALYLAESEAEAPQRMVHVPFKAITKETIKDGPLSPGGMELIADLQSALRRQKIAASAVNLSLPARDIIFRSFVIPWMQAHEVSSAVEFEAGKYLPFPLEELSFSFHPVTFTENNAKRIRIIFAAIKNDTLENYIKILGEASLNVSAIEPAASSLIRVLSLKNLLPEGRTIALIEKEEVGRIIIIDEGVPQFVREFHLSAGADEQAQEGDEAEVKKLTKEVRISLDYFSRRNEQLRVRQILLLTSSLPGEWPQNLEKNLAMPVAAIDGQSVLGEVSRMGIGILHAYGASIIPSQERTLYFDLSRKRAESTRPPSRPLPKKPVDYKALIKTALVCVSLMIVSLAASGLWTQRLKREINSLKQKVGSYQDADISAIEQKEMGLAAKLSRFKNTRTRSDIASFLLLIPGLLPEGTWLQNLDIVYDDSAAFAETPASPARKAGPARTGAGGGAPALTVAIEGYAYSQNKNEQFRLVNTLLRNLKDSEEFSAFFQDIDLETTNARQLGEYPVTAFKIVCTRSDEFKRPQ